MKYLKHDYDFSLGYITTNGAMCN